MKQPKVAIIICTYNQEKLLEITLNSLKKNTNYKNYKVIVVDDASEKKIGEKIKKKFKWVEVIRNSKNKGFGGSSPSQDAFLLQRYFIHADLKHDSGLRFFLQGKFAHANFRDKAGFATLEYHADFHQAFVYVQM